MILSALVSKGVSLVQNDGSPSQGQGDYIYIRHQEAFKGEHYNHYYPYLFADTLLYQHSSHTY